MLQNIQQIAERINGFGVHTLCEAVARIVEKSAYSVLLGSDDIVIGAIADDGALGRVGIDFRHYGIEESLARLHGADLLGDEDIFDILADARIMGLFVLDLLEAVGHYMLVVSAVLEFSQCFQGAWEGFIEASCGVVEVEIRNLLREFPVVDAGSLEGAPEASHFELLFRYHTYSVLIPQYGIVHIVYSDKILVRAEKFV